MSDYGYSQIYPCCIHCDGDPICASAPNSHYCHCDEGCQTATDTIKESK